MAIYHFSAKIIGRSTGRSAVASAAYRAAERLHDDKLGLDHNYKDKVGVEHREIMLPDGAPSRWLDRQTLWNEVEAGEKRKDAQLARDIELSLPRELGKSEAIKLAQDFVRQQFVARGMVADLNVHWTKARDGEEQPHAHVMLTMREIVAGPSGHAEEGTFGKKVVAWNDRGLLREWRERWAEMANARLHELGHDVRIDHRSYAEQGIALEPQNKIGPAGARREERDKEAERAAEHRGIARRNGEALVAEPEIALRALTQQHSTFSKHDLVRFLNRHTDGAEQFGTVMAKVAASPELVFVGQDGRGRDRFTTRTMLDTEARLERDALALVATEGHQVSTVLQIRAMLSETGNALGRDQQAAFEHVTDGRDLSVVVGFAGTGKSTMLGVAREAWESQGYRVRGAALSGIAAEGLEGGSGIASRTLASLEWSWKEGRDELTSRDVLVVDEAGMIGSRQLDQVVSRVRAAGAKLVLVGDPEQLQAIEAGAAFRAIAERVGAVEIAEVRRQREAGQREATRELATGQTAEALGRYEAAGMVQGHDTHAAAKAALVAGWDAERRQNPGQSRVILAATKVDVAELNTLARERLRAAGALGVEHSVETERGVRLFAPGDRIMFGRNERGLGAGPYGQGGVAVKNGTLGTVMAVEAQGGRLTVRLDGGGAGPEGKDVTFYVRDYAHVDHGYAATVHKAQGVTVDRAHVLASRYMDRHGTYTGLTRHRDRVALHWGRDEFANRSELERVLGRERAKDTSLDYGDGATLGSDDLRQRYGARRGLGPLRPESAIVVQPPERTPKRGMFTGLKLGTGRVAPAPERVREEPEQAAGLLQAVGRFAAAWQDARRMREQGLPILAHQHQALIEAQALVEAARPEFCNEVAMALRDGPALIGPAAMGASGRAALIAAAEAGQAHRQEEARREAERQVEAARRAELDPVRAQLLEARMEAWWETEKPGVQLWNRDRVPPAEVAQARAGLSRVVEALPDAELRRFKHRWEREAQQERDAPRPRSGPSMGM